jgi:predicted DCC family thiol-disulfide oxidoreductase YuxK
MTPGRVTRYFDGGCPLCRREVAQYRRLDRDGQVRWLDISTHSADLVAEGILLDEALARLHVRGRLRRPLGGAPVPPRVSASRTRVEAAARAGTRLPPLRPLAPAAPAMRG